MEKKEILASLQTLADELDETGLYTEATTLTNVMQKLAYESYDYAAENGIDSPMENTVEAETDDENDQDGIDQEIYKKMFEQFSNIINK